MGGGYPCSHRVEEALAKRRPGIILDDMHEKLNVPSVWAKECRTMGEHESCRVFEAALFSVRYRQDQMSVMHRADVAGREGRDWTRGSTLCGRDVIGAMA